MSDWPRAELGAPEPLLTQLKETQQLMAHGGDHISEKFKEARQQLLCNMGGDRRSEQGSNTTLLGRDSAYIRARLERDGKTELLAKMDAHEMRVRSKTTRVIR